MIAIYKKTPFDRIKAAIDTNHNPELNTLYGKASDIYHDFLNFDHSDASMEDEYLGKADEFGQTLFDILDKISSDETLKRQLLL